MKKVFTRTLAIGLSLLAGLGFFIGNAYAEEATSNTPIGTRIGITPTSQIFNIASNSQYDGELRVENRGDAAVTFEVYSAPYSYIYSEEEDLYKLGFNNENNYTQITRWITFLDNSGNYTDKATFSLDANNDFVVHYRINTPDDIPSGGQYAVIFVHTLSNASSESGIRTEASPGLIVYGRSTEGEAKESVEITDLKIERGVTTNNVTRNNFYASAKIKNTGNIDFNAYGEMKAEPIIGFSSYETPANRGRISVIPESELVLSDEWEETPDFGVYKVTWTIEAAGQTETVERILFLVPMFVVVIAITLLTILTIWIIIRVRKRKERRSRLAI